MGKYPCQVPECCAGFVEGFHRPGDLERHYREVHASQPQKDCVCTAMAVKGVLPFTRRDHYRDHLCDFHKEDIGASCGARSKSWDHHHSRRRLILESLNLCAGVGVAVSFEALNEKMNLGHQSQSMEWLWHHNCLTTNFIRLMNIGYKTRQRLHI